jgi:CheY-like chemotaxis protein
MRRRIGNLFVVDDDALNRRLVSATLAWEGLRTSSSPPLPHRRADVETATAAPTVG